MNFNVCYPAARARSSISRRIWSLMPPDWGRPRSIPSSSIRGASREARPALGGSTTQQAGSPNPALPHPDARPSTILSDGLGAGCQCLDGPLPPENSRIMGMVSIDLTGG